MEWEDPDPVAIGVRFLYVNLVWMFIIGVLNIVQGGTQLKSGAMPDLVTQIILMILPILVYGFFIYMISKGKNWARIVYLVLFVLGFFSAVFSFPQLMGQGTFPLVGVIGGTLLSLIGLIYIFKSESLTWFK